MINRVPGNNYNCRDANAQRLKKNSLRHRASAVKKTKQTHLCPSRSEGVCAICGKKSLSAGKRNFKTSVA
jgi:hypothetical protein